MHELHGMRGKNKEERGVTLRASESKILLIARGTMPGASVLPMMVCVLPDPVGPYAKMQP